MTLKRRSEWWNAIEEKRTSTRVVYGHAHEDENEHESEDEQEDQHAHEPLRKAHLAENGHDVRQEPLALFHRSRGSEAQHRQHIEDGATPGPRRGRCHEIERGRKRPSCLKLRTVHVLPSAPV